MKKRGIALLLAMGMAVQLTACTKSPSIPETSPAQTGTADASGPEETGPDVAGEDPADGLAVGEEISGFTLQRAEPYSPLDAEILTFTHEYSGAQLCYIKNGDTNRSFSIAFRTPHVDETDSNHIFEHAILSGSEKYPSKNLFFDLAGNTYNTYANASTHLPFTLYPVSSQSEEQLLLMADAYLSCMASPDLLRDERIFKREGIRYMLYDVEDPIAMGGTVFSEDMGYLTNIGDQALRALLQEIYPGEYAANYVGRASVNYQDLTYEHVIENYERCYSFDNSLILLYGDLDYRKFLEFIDREYLSKAKARGTDLSAYDDPVTAPGYVEGIAYSPAYEGDAAEDASVIYYAMDLDGKDWDTLCQYDLLGEMLSSDSSVFQEELKAAGLTAPADAGLIPDGEKPMFYFGMEYADPEDAKTFKTVVDKVLADIAQNGLDSTLVETVLKIQDIDNRIMMENPFVAVDLVFPEICTKWAQTGETDYFTVEENALQALQKDTDQARIRELAAGLKNAARSAMITTVPQPGLAEQIVAGQEAYLEEMKASMTPEELEQMVEDTLAFDEWNASELANGQIAIPVEALPEPEEPAAFTREESDGILYYAAASDVDQISLHGIYFDTSAVPQEDLHYIILFSNLMGELATENYDKAEKDNLMVQYLYGLDIDTAYPKAGERQYPMLRMEWYCMAEDYETSLRLLTDIVGGLKLDDKDELIRVLDTYLPAMDWSRGDSFDLSGLISIAGVDKNTQYREYMTGQRFYEFAKKLRERLDADPDAMEEITAKLRSIQEFLLHKDGMIVMNVAPESELGHISDISRQVLGELPTLSANQAELKIPQYPKRVGVIVESANYCTNSASDLNQIEDLSGSFFPFVDALSDRYVVPKIRFQGLAYSAGMGYDSDLETMYTYTYSDPNVADTVAVIDGEADALAAMELTQEELDRYILKAYAIVTDPMGILDKYLSSMYNDVIGVDQERRSKLASGVRTATVEDKEQAVETLRKLLQDQYLATVGNAELLREEADTFGQVYDYRKPLDQQP